MSLLNVRTGTDAAKSRRCPWGPWYPATARGYKSHTLAVAAMVAYVSLSLLPLLSSGYYSDDLITSTFRGQLQVQGVSFIEYFIETNRFWIHSNGRLFPVHLFTISAISYLSSSLLTYKAILLSLNVIDVLLFGYMLRLHTEHRATAYLGMLVLPTLFQFRLYHDPILSFCGMMQVFVASILAAMIFLYKYLEHNRTPYLLVSLLFYNSCLYYYEVGILLLPLFVVIVERKRASLKGVVTLASPYAVSALVALGAMGVVRHMRDVAAASYPGIAFNLEAEPMVRAFALQLYASLPLTYVIGNPSGLFRHDVRIYDVGSVVANIAWTDLVALVPLTLLYTVWLRRPAVVEGIPSLCALGGILMVAPSFVVSMSLKYQGDLRAAGRGMGYILVYVEYFGTASVITGCLLLAFRTVCNGWARRVAGAMVLGVLAIVLLVNLQSNRLVVEKANIDLHYRRAALARALSDNVLDDVRDGDGVYILDEYTFDPYPWVNSHVRGWATGYPWKNEALVYLYAKKRVRILTDLNDLRYGVGTSSVAEPVRDTYLLKVKSYPDAMRRKEAYVVLSKVQEVYRDQGGEVHIESIPVRFDFPSGG